ncbi:MAG: ribbon-helix-helix protein, CopG family [Tepidiformaceae bacterium]
MTAVKTAISLPEDIFAQVEEIAERESRTRSAVITEAVAAFLRKRAGEEITRQLNEVYANEPLDDDDRRMLDAAAFDMAKLLNEEDGGWPQ